MQQNKLSEAQNAWLAALCWMSYKPAILQLRSNLAAGIKWQIDR